jgi:hypothetical protein
VSDSCGFDLTEGVPGIVSDAPTCVPDPALGVPDLPPIVVQAPYAQIPLPRGPLTVEYPGAPDLPDEYSPDYVPAAPVTRGGVPAPRGGMPIAAPRRSPAPVPAPILPEITVSAPSAGMGGGLDPFGPIGATFLPFYLRTEMLSPEEALADALARAGRGLPSAPRLTDPQIGGPLRPDLQRLFNQPPPAPPRTVPTIPQEFPDLATTATNPDQLALFETEAEVPSVIEAAPTLLGRLFSFLGVGVGLAAQPTEAGYSLATEIARVTAELAGQPVSFPVTLAGPERLPLPTSFPIGGFQPDAPLAELVSTAPRVAPTVDVAPTLGLGTFNVGVGEVPTVGPTPAPHPFSPTQPVSRPGLGPGSSSSRPLPSPSNPPAPKRPPTVSPLTPPLPTPQSLAQPKPALPPASASTCPKTPQKKQKKQKKQPRQICYRGTYTELSSGLIKHRKERIQCR